MTKKQSIWEDYGMVGMPQQDPTGFRDYSQPSPESKSHAAGFAPDEYVSVTFTNYHTDPNQVHETSEYVLMSPGHLPMGIKVVLDRTSGVRSFEGGDDARYMMKGESLSVPQVLTIAMPLSLGESTIVDVTKVTNKQIALGPMAWAQLLAVQGPYAIANRPRVSTYLPAEG